MHNNVAGFITAGHLDGFKAYESQPSAPIIPNNDHQLTCFVLPTSSQCEQQSCP